MKKVILIITAIVMVASGVAAVSAYEAHTINVIAKVENAISVSTNATDFGTVFPEEWVSEHFSANLSGSFCDDQTRVDTVNITVWAEWKEKEDTTPYPWLGEALYIMANGNKGYIGANITAPFGAQPALDINGAQMQALMDNISGTNDILDSLLVYLYLDVPVFEDFYNENTDVPDKPRADWADALLAKAWGGEWTAANIIGEPSMKLPPDTPQGYVMGLDIKIQVVDIWNGP